MLLMTTSLLLMTLQILCFVSFGQSHRQFDHNPSIKRIIRASKSNHPTGAAIIPEMKAPVFRLSHTSNGLHADKMTSYRSDEEGEYEEEEYGEADEVQYYDDATQVPYHENPTIDAELANATSDTDIINKLLNRGYDWRVRPPGTNLTIPGSHGPVVVVVNMLIRSISKIDDVNMEYSVQITFRETWIDGRLAYGLPGDNKPDFLILSAGQQIWMPDSFFQNEKQAQKHMIDKPNVLIRVHKDGKILYSVRISMILSCPMHLQFYPMDVQTCHIDLASYAYTTDDIEYQWKDQEPVQLKKGLESSLPSFQLNNVSTTYCTSKTNTGIYSCLRTVLILRRQFSYYLLQLYIPSTMLVIVSWVSFWLPRTAVPARVTLGVTTLLTMTTQASGINAKLPPVSYSKAIDIWTGSCLTFIFGALLEFAVVTYMASRDFVKKNKNQSVEAPPPMIGGQNSFATGNPRLVSTPLISAQTPDHYRSPPPIDNDIWKRRPSPPNPLSDVVIKFRETGVERELRQGDSSQERLTSTAAANGRRTEVNNRLHQPRLSTYLINYLWKIPPLRRFLKQIQIEDRAKRADYLSRLMFPVLFLLFNVCYWIRYSSYTPTQQA